MNWKTSLCMKAAVALLALAVSSTQANASFVTGFSGNSDFSPLPPGPSPAGFVNFAVWDNLGQLDPDPFVGLAGALGTTKAAMNPQGTGPIDDSARFVYLYELQRTSGATIDDVKVFENSLSTSVGWFDEHVFDGPLDGDGRLIGDPTGVAAGGQNPNASETQAEDGLVRWEYEDPRLTDRSTILFLTAELGPPEFGLMLVENGSNSITDVPVPTPEPGSLALLLIGAAGYASWRRYDHKRKQKKEATK